MQKCWNMQLFCILGAEVMMNGWSIFSVEEKQL